jgi:ligand-binding SRPBCC domain-containing protein
VVRLSDVEITSVVAAPQDVVWDRIASVAGVNHELGPLVRMTAPPHVDRIAMDALPLERIWFRSKVLILGVPVDYDDLTIVQLEPGRRFLERSQMRSMRMWQHERILEAAGDGATRVTDRLTFTTRALVPHALARAVVRLIFRHRHKRLAAWFSGSGPAP